jgi:hypothetical protein
MNWTEHHLFPQLRGVVSAHRRREVESVNCGIVLIRFSPDNRVFLQSPRLLTSYLRRREGRRVISHRPPPSSITRLGHHKLAKTDPSTWSRLYKRTLIQIRAGLSNQGAIRSLTKPCWCPSRSGSRGGAPDRGLAGRAKYGRRSRTKRTPQM